MKSLMEHLRDLVYEGLHSDALALCREAVALDYVLAHQSCVWSAAGTGGGMPDIDTPDFERLPDVERLNLWGCGAGATHPHWGSGFGNGDSLGSFGSLSGGMMSTMSSGRSGVIYSPSGVEFWES